MDPMKPSVQLAAITGVSPLPRTEVVSKVWSYIKKHGLQDQRDRKMINPDQVLGAVLGTTRVNLFEMTRLLSKHLMLPEAQAKTRTSPRKKPKAKRPRVIRKAPAIFFKPFAPSPALARIVGKRPLPRTQVMVKVWGYIKKNRLQDPVNRRMINPDQALGAVLGTQQLSIFQIAARLMKHLVI